MDESRHLTNEERAAYWQRTLTPDALLAASDHLRECAQCREEMLRERPVVTAGQPETEAVTYEELVAWMDGDLDPLARRELAERITRSPRTSMELVNLLRFRDEMNELPAEDYSLPEARRSSWGPRWVWPLAAGLALGLAFLWLSSTARERSGQLVLVDQGKQLVVRQNGEIPALGKLPGDLQQAVHDAVSLGKVDLPAALTELRPSDETLVGLPPGNQTFRVLAPVGSVVASRKPMFRWTTRADATAFRINLLPKGSGEVISSPLLTAGQTTWAPGEPLSPNETYEWEVEALRDGELLAKAPAPPEPEARFRVLDAASQAQLEQLRRDFSGSHLMLGLAYAKAGLIAEARNEFEQLARENPQNPLPKKLLAGLTNH